MIYGKIAGVDMGAGPGNSGHEFFAKWLLKSCCGFAGSKHFNNEADDSVKAPQETSYGLEFSSGNNLTLTASSL
ncbi:MAG: hypothetical protein R2788_09445 [Saprospiraceae bacterium]